MIALMGVVFLSPYCHSMLKNHDVCGIFAEPLEASGDHPQLIWGSLVKKNEEPPLDFPSTSMQLPASCFTGCRSLRTHDRTSETRARSALWNR